MNSLVVLKEWKWFWRVESDHKNQVGRALFAAQAFEKESGCNFLWMWQLFDSFETSKMMRHQEERFHVWGKFKMCVDALCFTIVWKTYMLAEDGKQLMVVTQSSFHVLWQRDLIQFHRKSSNKTIIWLSCPFLFHDFLPQLTKRSLQNTWLNHPLLYKSSWMGTTNPVFVQLHFLECFLQASARNSVDIVYRVCKCYQLFDIWSVIKNTYRYMCQAPSPRMASLRAVLLGLILLSTAK